MCCFKQLVCVTDFGSSQSLASASAPSHENADELVDDGFGPTEHRDLPAIAPPTVRHWSSAKGADAESCATTPFVLLLDSPKAEDAKFNDADESSSENLEDNACLSSHSSSSSDDDHNVSNLIASSSESEKGGGKDEVPRDEVLKACTRIRRRYDIRPLRRVTSPTSARQLKRVQDRMHQGADFEPVPLSPAPYAPPLNVVLRHPYRRGPRRCVKKPNVRSNNEMEKKFLYGSDERREWNGQRSDSESDNGDEVWDHINQAVNCHQLAQAAEDREASEREQKDRDFVAGDDDDGNLTPVVNKRRLRPLLQNNVVPVSSRIRSGSERTRAAIGGSVLGRRTAGQPMNHIADLLDASEQSDEENNRRRSVRFESSPRSGGSSSEAEDVASPPARGSSARKRTDSSARSQTCQDGTTRQSKVAKKTPLVSKRSKLMDENGNCIPSTSARACQVFAEEAEDAACNNVSDDNGSSSSTDAVERGDVDGDDVIRLPRRERRCRRLRVTLRQRGLRNCVEKFRALKENTEDKQRKGVRLQRKNARRVLREKRTLLLKLQAGERRSHRAFAVDDEDAEDNSQSTTATDMPAILKHENLASLHDKIKLVGKQIQQIEDRKRMSKRISRPLADNDDEENDGGDEPQLSERENDDAVEVSDESSADEVAVANKGRSLARAAAGSSRKRRISNENNPAFEVERIVRMVVEAGPPKKVWYEIKWKNYPDDENTQEPERCLNGCLPLLQEFRRNLVLHYRKLLSFDMLATGKNIPPGEYFLTGPPQLSPGQQEKKNGNPFSPVVVEDNVLYQSVNQCE